MACSWGGCDTQGAVDARDGDEQGLARVSSLGGPGLGLAMAMAVLGLGFDFPWSRLWSPELDMPRGQCATSSSIAQTIAQSAARCHTGTAAPRKAQKKL